MADGSNQLVLAFFDSEADADRAASDLKAWDGASDEVKLGAIGVLVKDENGKIKTHKLGARAGGKGAKTGIILGVVAAILSGGVTLLGGIVGGAVGGGILGSLFHRGLGMSDDDISRIGHELDQGRAAVGVVVTAAEAPSVSAMLKDLGGKPESHSVADEAMDKATTAVESAQPEAAPAEQQESAPEGSQVSTV